MWKLRYSGVEPACAVICAVLTQRLSTRSSELPAELVCWLVLPALFWATSRGESVEEKQQAVLPSNREDEIKSPRRSIWIFAISIAASSCFKNEGGIVKLCVSNASGGRYYLGTDKLQPAITPFLLASQETRAPNSDSPSTSSAIRASSAMNTTWGASLVAIFSTMALLYWDLRGAIPAIVPAVSLYVLYATLLDGTSRRSLFLRVSLDEAIVPISARAVVLLAMAWGMQAFMTEELDINVPSMLALGLAKALSWYTLAKTACPPSTYVSRWFLTDIQARSSTWCVATTMGTFAIASTRSPFVQSSEAQALAHIATSILALGQTIQFLPKHTMGRSVLWGFALLSLVPYAANILAIRDAQFSVVSRNHPVESLVTNSKAEFEQLVQRQSKSYDAARREYLRRYNVEPPSGFREWYEFAKSQNSPIIDDFDIIYEGVSPFWELSGIEVREVMEEARHAELNQLWACSTATTNCSHRYRTRDRDFPLLFNTLLKDVSNAIPDVEFLINHFDEPAVVLPQSEDEKHSGDVRVRNMRRKRLWSHITNDCGLIEGEGDDAITETSGLPFIANITESRDLCHHLEYKKTHGLLERLASGQLIEGMVPVLSTGGFSTMGDIIFPSPAYIQDGFKYDPAGDVEWDDKRDNVYWAGSTTGGYAADEQWRLYQRQRFVELAQNLAAGPYSYLREVGGVITRVTSPFLNSRLFDVAFTRINQCKKKYCREQEDYFRLMGWAGKDEALHSKLVFDIDGNGISGRYYKLLASKSTPLKMTILREWHDERLVPWVHYVPVSMSMKELPELVSYFTLTEEGQKSAREIAEAGRKWYLEALREEDMAVYVYRLLLELARLQDPEREARIPRPAVGESG